MRCPTRLVSVSVGWAVLLLGVGAGFAAEVRSGPGRWPVLAVAERVEGRQVGEPIRRRSARLEDDALYLRVELTLGREVRAEELEAKGAVVVVGEGRFWDVLLPVGEAERVLEALGPVEVRERLRPWPHVLTGEQVSLLRTALYVTNGFDGRGVRVGVIDGGFHGYQAAVSMGELPADVRTVSFALTAVDADDGEGSRHGTAVAEVLHETAPKAELHLIKVDSGVGLRQAARYCVENGIRIVNHSMGWYNDGWRETESFVYGQCVLPFVEEADGLWVNSAGNDAERHYQSEFRAYGATSYHDFGGEDYGEVEVPVPSKIVLYLNWDAYDDYYAGRSFVDYDLELYSPAGVFLVASTKVQPYQPPSERLEWDAGTPGMYRYKVRVMNGAARRPFQVFSANHRLVPMVRSNSLVMPAEGERVLSVGAVHWSNWAKPGPQVMVRPYSSRGPSKTGRVKPDLVGIDGMTNSVYGAFNGTSASSPVVAGLAALILSKQPYLSGSQLRHTLVDNCEDIWLVGPDMETGHGRPVLTLFPRRRNRERLATDAALIVAPTRLRRGERLHYYGVSDTTTIRLRTAAGVLVAEFRPRQGVYATAENFLELPWSRMADGVYVLEFEAGRERLYRKIVVVP